MIYQVEVITPANTPETLPLRTSLRVTKGLVYKFHLYMPHGAMGMHCIQVFDGSFQLWPTTPGRAFRGDGIIVDFDDIYLKAAEPYEFQVRSWNADTTYEHLVIISVGMVSEEAYMARFLPGAQWERMAETWAQLAAAQEAQRQAIMAWPFTWLEKGE